MEELKLHGNYGRKNLQIDKIKAIFDLINKLKL